MEKEKEAIDDIKLVRKLVDEINELLSKEENEHERHGENRARTDNVGKWTSQDSFFSECCGRIVKKRRIE